MRAGAWFDVTTWSAALAVATVEALGPHVWPLKAAAVALVAPSAIRALAPTGNPRPSLAREEAAREYRQLQKVKERVTMNYESNIVHNWYALAEAARTEAQRIDRRMQRLENRL